MSCGDEQAKVQEFLLIAEDNPADVGLIRMALKRHGIGAAVEVVQDGEAALRFIE